MSQENRIIANKLMNFNYQLGKWTYEHINQYFNVNGKNKYPFTTRQFQILAFIAGTGKTTISQLEKFFLLSKSSLSITVDKMVDANILKKEREEKNDKRIVYITLSENGEKMFKKEKERLYDLYEGFYDSLNDNQKYHLREGIEHLSKIFEHGEEV